MEANLIKFKGKLNGRFPQLFPKDNKPYSDGDFCILNMDVIEEIEGDIKVNKYGTITIKGFMPYINDLRKTYIVLAEVTQDEKYGEQNTVIMIREDLSIDSREDQISFLRVFLTDIQVKNLLEIFPNPVEIIENEDIESLCQVKGVKDATARSIIKKYKENIDYSKAYIELSTYGLTPHMIKKLVDHYESPETLIAKIIANPYILASEVEGIGFKKADEIALANGMDKFSQKRLRAFITHVLDEGGKNGYSWISSSILVDKIETDLEDFPIEEIVQAVNALKERRVIWDGEKGKVALQKYYDLECKIRDELVRIRDGENKLDFNGWEDRVKQAEILQGWEYEQEQMEAIKDTLEHQVNIISGKAGSGKTSTALGAVKALGNILFHQCALSGKAAARIQEVTGYPASTIHRLLGVNGKSKGSEEDSMFVYNKEFTLPHDALLVDEFSMIGGLLFLSLLEAIPTGCKLILLGDYAQLPAIGALNIGMDLTMSPYIHTNELTIIHRQARKSAVITESIRVSLGEQIVDKDWVGKEIRGELQDLELDIYSDKSETVEKCLQHFKEKLVLSGNDISEVQLLVPMNMRGDSSAYNLNNLVQEIYNPQKDNLKEVYLPLEKKKGYILRVGDKVINTVNNYKMTELTGYKCNLLGWEDACNKETGKVKEIAIFNGFTGEILDIEGNDLIIYFPLVEKTVRVSSSHWRNDKGILLAYALTAHKAQGSSYKYPICVIDYSHYIMLSKELIYTMMTRASLYCTLIAENRALRYAITRTATQDKQTFLKDLLEGVERVEDVA